MPLHATVTENLYKRYELHVRTRCWNEYFILWLFLILNEDRRRITPAPTILYSLYRIQMNLNVWLVQWSVEQIQNMYFILEESVKTIMRENFEYFLNN